MKVWNQAVYSLIKELEVRTGRRVKGEAGCKCKSKCRVRCERGAKCECGVRCERRAKCEHEHEARAQSEIHKMGCILFISFFICMYR